MNNHYRITNPRYFTKNGNMYVLNPENKYNNILVRSYPHLKNYYYKTFGFITCSTESRYFSYLKKFKVVIVDESLTYIHIIK